MCVADLYQFVKVVLPIGNDGIDRAFSGGETRFSQRNKTIIPQYVIYVSQIPKANREFCI